jgi:tetratricopeptide (TPR) repeat protein
VYLQPAWRVFYRPFRDLDPVAVVGHSIRVYWVDRWPDTTGRDAEGADLEVHRFLGDALLLAQRWPSRALRHYRVYLKERPNEARTLVNAAVALALTDDTDGAIQMLRTAVDVDPEHGEARLTLAEFLFAQGNLEGARMHAERAVLLLPSRLSRRTQAGSRLHTRRRESGSLGSSSCDQAIVAVTVLILQSDALILLAVESMLASNGYIVLAAADSTADHRPRPV